MPPPPPGGYPPPPPPHWDWVLPKEAYTPWSTRVAAFLIDFVPLNILFVLPYLMVLINDGAECAADLLGENVGYCRDEQFALFVIVLLIAWPLAAIYFFLNLCYRQGETGQSIGKSVMKFKLISAKTGQPIGFWLSFLRQLAHYVDQLICFIGYLWPLWDDQRQTIADKIMNTVCVPLDSQQLRPDPHPPPHRDPQPHRGDDYFFK